MTVSNNDIGNAGEFLVLSHMRSLGIPCAQLGAEHADIMAYIGEKWRSFQVKSSICQRTFGNASAWRTGEVCKRKNLTDYQVDAFAFCFLPAPYPYYVFHQAVEDNIRLSAGAFTRAGRDMSWEELLRRFGVTQDAKRAGGSLL